MQRYNIIDVCDKLAGFFFVNLYYDSKLEDMEHSIFKRIETSNKPNFGDILSKSIELFKKAWEQALYHCLITIAAVFPIVVAIYIPYIIFIFSMTGYRAFNFSNGLGYNDHPEITPYIPFVILYVLVAFVLLIIVQAISYGIIAHFFKVLKKIDTGSTEEVEGYFDLIRNNLSKLFVLSLSTFLIAFIAILACYFPIFYVLVPLNLLVVVFAFHPELSAFDIVKASFRLGNKYWLIIFGLIIIGSLLAQLGVFLCFVGLLFTAFFSYIPIYYIYKDSIGFDEFSESK